MIKEKIKPAKLTKHVMYDLRCPACGQSVSFDTFVLNLIVEEQNYTNLPDTIVCENCGARMSKPRNPFKSHTRGKAK